MGSNWPWVLERHTDDPAYCWRVRHAVTGETQGFGLTELDASKLAAMLNGLPC